MRGFIMTNKAAARERTKAALKEAFWSLYQQKSIEQISIREITDRAGYNRGTFYLYFKDVYDILEQVEQSLIDAIYDSPLMRCAETDTHIHVNEMIPGIIQIYRDFSPKLKVLLGPHGDPSFTLKIQNILKTELASTLNIPEDFPRESRAYYIEFITSGILAVILKWISEESSSAEYCLDDFIRTMIRILAPFSTLDFVE